MISFLKNILMITIVIFILVAAVKVIFGTLSLKGFTTDVTGSYGIAKDGLHQVTKTNPTGDFWGGSSSFGNTKSVLTSSPNASGSVSIKTPVYGGMVYQGSIISGTIKKTWLYEGVATARFLDESGMELGRSQVVGVGNFKTAPSTMPFEVTVFLKNPMRGTGYLSIENANPTGDPQKSLRFIFPITYGGELNSKQTHSINTSPTWSPTGDFWGGAGTQTSVQNNVTGTTTNTNTSGSSGWTPSAGAPSVGTPR